MKKKVMLKEDIERIIEERMIQKQKKQARHG